MRLILVAVFSGLLLLPCRAGEKHFLLLTQICHFVGGQVWVSNLKEKHYSEIIGSTTEMPVQICRKGFLDTRTCIDVKLYNFRLACRDGVASAAQLFMALFGTEETTRQNGFILNGNQ